MKEKDPFQKFVEAATNLKQACRDILDNEVVTPNHESTVIYYHEVVLDCLFMIEGMKYRIENYHDWNSRYGEDHED
jgi:hypothetical protein